MWVVIGYDLVCGHGGVKTPRAKPVQLQPDVS